VIRGTYLGLEAASRGLAAAQSALDTISHNVANANTEGYSRQRVNLKATEALPIPGILMGTSPGQQGTGVRVINIERMRDEFLEFVYRHESGVGGEADIIKSGLLNIQGFFNEPGEYGLGRMIENFFNSWEILSTDPESLSTRANLRDQAQTFINAVQTIDKQFDVEVRRLNDQILMKVNEINTIAKDIGHLNNQISAIEANNSQQANDLRDERDLLVAKLSRIINVEVVEDNFGAYSVNVGGHPLVEKNFTTPIVAKPYSTPVGVSYSLQLSSGLPLDLTRGELNGFLKLRDNILPDAWHNFNVSVSAIVNRVNQLHREGYGLDGGTNRSFFNDITTRELWGLTPLPALTGLDTKLSNLGITSGDFFIGNFRAIITDDDVSPDSTVTVRDVLTRIFNGTDGKVQGVLDTSGTTSGVILRMHNPPDMPADGTTGSYENDIDAKAGTSNFLQALGIDPTTEVKLEQDQPYVNVARTLSLNPLIAKDLRVIAAARANDDGKYSGPGDNRLALAMADLKNLPSFVQGDSISGYYQGTIVTVGVKVQEATRLTTNQELIMGSIENRRDAVAGVSLDEEAVNMIKFQRALEAAARMISVADQVLDLIINQMGYAGR
jgi:flagellar hook-associated protein 1 FlgK